MKATLRCAVLAVSILALASSAGAAASQPWDQVKLTELGKQLETNMQTLWNVFRQQPRPNVASAQSRSFFRLRQEIRQMRREARSLSSALQKGAGHDETLPSVESMMQTIRIAQDEARRVFTGVDVRDAAAAVRDVLNQMLPYFDLAGGPLEPVQR